MEGGGSSSSPSPTSAPQPPGESSVGCWITAACTEHSTAIALSVLVVYALVYLLVIGPRLSTKRGRGNKFFFHGRFLLFYGVVSFVSIFYIPIYALRPKNVANTLLICPVCKFVSWFLGVKWEVRGGDILDELAGRTGSRKEPKGAIFIANHQSTLDTLGMISIWDRLHPMAAVIKKEVFYVWPFGVAAYLAGSIYIDRSRGKTALYSIESCAHRAAKDKIKMFVFPEGTRNRANCSWGDDGAQKHLLPFKSGAFRAAISAGIPLVPVVYSPYTFVDEKRLLFDHGKAIIQILPEIPTEGLTVDDIPALMDKAQNIMTEKYQSLTKELLSELPSDHFALKKKAD